MAGENAEMQRIAMDIAKTLRNLSDTQRAIVEALREQKSGDNRPRREDKGESPTASMNINRRLSGSVKALTTNVDQTSKQMNSFARYLRIANRQLINAGKSGNVAAASSNRTNGANAQVDNSQLAKELRDLIAALNQRNNGGGGGNNNDNDNPRTPRDQPGMISNAIQQFIGGFSLKEALKKGYGEVTSAASRGGVYNFGTQTDAVMMGMDGQELVEMQAEYRSSILRATHGIDHWTESIRSSQSDLIAHTGSLKEAALVTATLQQNLLNIGFSFQEANDAIGSGKTGLIGNLKDLSIVTGKTVREIADISNNLVSSDNGRDLLRKMDRSQRLDYIQTQGQLLKYYTVLTGNIDRASEIITSQMERTKVDPRTRYIQSVKTMQAAVQSGMGGGDARRLQQLAAMNPRIIMQDEKLSGEWTRLTGQLHQNIKNMQGSSNFNTEWFGFFLEDLAQGVIDPRTNTELDTPLNNTNITQQQEKSLSTVIDSNALLKESLTWLQRIEAGVRNVLFMMAAGTAASLLRGPLSGTRGGSFRERFQRNRDTRTNGPQSNSTSVGGQYRDYLKSFGVGKVLKLAGLGLATAAVGYGADKLITPTSEKQEQIKNTAISALEWAGVGATIGTLIAPGIGTAIGGALGGVAGVIAGLNQDTKDQSVYDKELAKTKYDSDVQIMQARHEGEVTRLASLITQEQELMKNKTADEQAFHKTRIDDLQQQIKAQDELHRRRMGEATILTEITSQLLNKMSEKDSVRKALDNSFEVGVTNGFGNQFDVSEFIDQSGMSKEQLYSSIMTHVGNVSDKQARSIFDTIQQEGNIRGSENLSVINAWADSYQRSLETEAAALTAQNEQARKTAQESANANNMGDLFAEPVKPAAPAINPYMMTMGMGGMMMIPSVPAVDDYKSSQTKPPITSAIDNNSNVPKNNDNSSKSLKGNNSTDATGLSVNEDGPAMTIFKEQNALLSSLISITQQSWKENKELQVRLEEQRLFNEEMNKKTTIPPLLRRTTGQM